MEEKYPEQYFEHFMAIFNENLTEEALKDHLGLANAMEGLEYIKGLKEELQLIKLNNDQQHFIKKVREDGVKNFTEHHFEILINEATLMIEKRKS